MNGIMTTKFIKFMNFTKVARRTRTTTTIFKLIGPCEILSHGQICTYSAAKYFPAVFLGAKRVAAGVLPLDAGGTAS